MDNLSERGAGIVEFLNNAANHFERLPVDGEDMSFWANVYNAENCRKAAVHIEAQAVELGRMREALGELIYEITSLCPMETNGSHKPIISAAALEAARAALGAKP